MGRDEDCVQFELMGQEEKGIVYRRTVREP